MSDPIANEMTVREFFDKLQDRLTVEDKETGEKKQVLNRDKEIISTLRDYWKTDQLDNKNVDGPVFTVCWVLHCLRRALYKLITEDITEPWSKEKALQNYKNILSTEYEDKVKP